MSAVLDELARHFNANIFSSQHSSPQPQTTPNASETRKEPQQITYIEPPYHPQITLCSPFNLQFLLLH